MDRMGKGSGAMAPGLSVYLDALRFGAAMAVLIWHLSLPRFSLDALPGLFATGLGQDAVTVFFVLSGLVIGYVTGRGPLDGRRFAFDRWTRMISVTGPVLAIGLAVQIAFGELQRDAGAEALLTLLHGLTFSTDWAVGQVRLEHNTAIWSLSYEMGFYVLFGLAFYLRGARRIAALSVAVAVIGLNVLLLMPGWLMGLWVWRRIAAGRIPGQGVAVLLAAAPVAIYLAAKAYGVPDLAFALTHEIVGDPAQVDALRFADTFVWRLILGALVAAHLLGMARLLAEVRTPGARAIRWLAGGSFTLYLLHMPLIAVGYPIVRQMGTTGGWAAILVACAVVPICYAVAGPIERTLPAQRRAWRALGARLRPARNAKGPPLGTALRSEVQART